MSDLEPNLDSLFEAAVQIESAAERAAFLEKACGNDAELRRQVEQLLQSHEQAGSFLDKPPAGLEATTGPGASDGNLAASLEAGLASAFGEDEAVVVGGAGNSVLKMLGLTMDVPHVALRDAAAEGDDPVQRPSSPEIPRHDTDSRYQLQGEIARGGMGAVIKGRDTDLGRDLAIKVLLEEHKAKPEVIQRFVEEAQIGGQLQHPGITPVYELGQFADQRPFFSMKLVKGKTLSALLEERADPAVDRMKFLGIFEQVCQTMAYAHSRGVIHRDLKPANIMVGAFGEVQVMDWGLAKVLPAGGVADEKKASTRQKSETVIQTMRDVGSDTPDKFGSAGSDTQMGSIMGTPAYMPPEQALGEVDRLDERADVFGLGAILCEILTGKPPYVAVDGTQVFRQARRGKLDECFDRLDACSSEPELIDLAKRALAAEPEQRPRNASAMADSITSYLVSVQERLKQAELAKAEAHARAEHATRRRRLVMAIAGLLLVIAVGAGFSALEFRRQREAKSVLAGQNFELAEENDKKREEAENATRLVEIEKRKVEEEREALRQEQYLSDMLLVQQAYESGSVGRVRELLNKHIPLDDEKDRRTFEWYYWWRASHNERESTALTTAGISVMIVSPDQRFIATSGLADRLDIRDARTLELIAFKRHEPARANSFDAMMRTYGGLSQSMAFSHDGAILATVNNNKARLWDTSQLRTGDSRVDGKQELTQLSTIRRAGKINAIAFSPTDTSLAVTVANGQITIWDPQKPSAPQVEIPNDSRIVSLAFSPDGTLLAALPVINPYLGQDSRILIYDLKQRKLRRTLAGRQRQILSLAWGAAAGRSVIATGSNVGNICLWDGETFEDRDTLTAVGQKIAGLTFSPDGSRLAARLVEEQAVQIWQTDNSRVVTTIRGHDARVVGAGFIEQAKGLVSCGMDGSVKTWNLSETRAFLEAGIARNPAVSAQSVIGSMDANGDGKISRNEATAELKPYFDQYDKNKDGAIDESEAQVMADHASGQQVAPASAEQIVASMDSNSDGRISRDEASAELKPYFEQIDTNKDGAIDVKEAKVMADYASGQQVAPASAEQIVASMDSNSDGRISRDEASAELKPYFEQIDANKDGVIAGGEIEGLVAAANGQMPGAVSGQGTEDRMLLKFGRVGPYHRSLRELLHLDRFFGAAESTEFTGLSDNGEFLAVLKPDGDSTVRLELWQVIDSQRQLIHQQDGIPASINRAVDISVADDGSRVAFASPDLARGALPGGVAIHDVATGSTVFADTPSVRLVALSPDGNRLAAMHGRPPRLWVLNIADGKIRDEDLEAGQRRRLDGSSAIQLDTQMATDCVFSPDGQYLAVATDNNGIAIIDCQSIEKIRNLQGHTRGVYTLAFSPDGSQLCSGGEDGTVRVWGFPSGQRRQTLRGHDTAVTAVVFSGEPGDGQSITSIDAMGRILVWPTATKAEIENHAEYWKARAEKHERNGDAANAGADWIRYFALNPNVPDTERFEVLTEYEQWEAAAEAGSRMLVDAPPDRALAWLGAAPVIALSTNKELYREFCQRMAHQFAETTDGTAAEQTCKACLLIPDAIDIEQLPYKLFSGWMNEGKAPSGIAHWLWTSRGLVAHRRGNAEAAITYVNRSEERNPPDIAKALNRAILALAHHRLGDLEQARKDVQQATEILDRAEASNVRPANYWDLLIARILRDEARTLIEGDAKPSNRAVP